MIAIDLATRLQKIRANSRIVVVVDGEIKEIKEIRESELRDNFGNWIKVTELIIN